MNWYDVTSYYIVKRIRSGRTGKEAPDGILGENDDGSAGREVLHEGVVPGRSKQRSAARSSYNRADHGGAN